MYYLNWLINKSSILGLKGGFWFIGLPFAILLIYVEYYNWKKQHEEDDKDIPIENIIINLTKEEKWMLENLIKRSGQGNLDNYVSIMVKNLRI